MLEKILFKKIELWAIIPFLLFGSVTAIWLAWRALSIPDALELGGVDRMVREVAGLPDDASQLYSSLSGPPSQHMLAWTQRFEGESGLQFSYAPGARPDLGYVLINRFDGDAGRSVSELVDLDSQEVVHRWWFDVDPVWEEVEYDSAFIDLPVDRGTDRFRNFATLLGDGSVVVQYFTPLLRFDHCSRLLWSQPVDEFHHSIELDGDGNIWAPTTIEPKTVALGNWQFHDNGIGQVSPDGEVLLNRSVVGVFEENGLGVYIYGQGDAHNDPVHVNDIQPVLEDGVVWRKGDVFISMRHKSMVMLYRPATNRVLWTKVGPWMHQHDVDILDDRRIAIFDNDARTKYIRHSIVPRANDLVILDVVDGSVERPFRDAFARLDIRTPIEGLADFMSDDELMVEETVYGRLVAFDRSGDIVWQFVNRARNGNIYLLSWSRLVPRETGDAVRRKIREEPCNG